MSRFNWIRNIWTSAAMQKPAGNETLIRAEQLRQLASGLPMSVATSTALAIILALVQRSVINASLIWSWLTLIAVVAALRVLMANQWARTGTDTSDSSLKQFRWGAIIAGASWGLGSVLLFPAHDPLHQVFLGFVMAGLSAGGIIAYSLELGCAVGFVLPALLPFVLRLFMEGGEIPTTMGVTVSLFLVFAVTSIRRLHRDLLANITLRIEASAREALLIGLDRRHQLHLRQTELAVIEWDAGNRVTQWNPAAEAIFGYSGAEAMGRHASFLVTQSAQEAADGIWDGVTVPRSRFNTNDNVRKDGSTIRCEWNHTVLFDEHNRRIGMVSMARDLTSSSA